MKIKKLTNTVNSSVKEKIISQNKTNKSSVIKKITPRKLPNCISYSNEAQGYIGGFIKFYPQDIDLLKNMTIDEQIKYKSMLIDLGCYYR